MWFNQKKKLATVVIIATEVQLNRHVYKTLCDERGKTTRVKQRLVKQRTPAVLMHGFKGVMVVRALFVKQNSGSAVVMSVNPFSSIHAGNNRELMADSQYDLQLVTLRCHPVIVTQEVKPEPSHASRQTNGQKCSIQWD